MEHLVISEKKRNAPYSGKSYKGIYKSADYSCLTAEYPGYDIKLKNTDTAPVQPSYYQESK